jgi:hypothetical protein
MMTPVGEIPASDALRETQGVGDSLVELLSRDPETLRGHDRDKIIAIMRDQRQRWDEAERSGTTRAAARVTVAETKLATNRLGLKLQPKSSP